MVIAERFGRMRTPLFLIFFVVIFVYLTITIIRIPSIGAVLEREQNHVFVVRSVEPASQAKVLGIEIGDIILEINGKPAHAFENVVKYNSLEYAETVLVQHEDQSLNQINFAKSWSGKHTTHELMLQLYIPGLSFFVFIAFSVFLYLKRKEDRSAIMLILFFSSIGLSYYSSAASHRSDPVGLSVIYVVIPCIPLLFMMFMNLYLQRFGAHFIRKRTLLILFGGVGIVSVSSLIYIWTNLFQSEVMSYIKIAFSGIILIGNLVCVLKLIEKFLKHKNTKLQSLFTITLTAHIVAFTPFATMNLLPMIFGEKQILPAAFTALFLLILPVVYFYLTTSNQLFDIEFILSRFKYYSSLAIIPSLLVASLITIVLQSEDHSEWLNWLKSFIIVYIVLIAFLYMKEQIDQKYRPKLFKAMYSYQDSIDRFSRNVARIMKQSDLEHVLISEINALLPVNRVSILVINQGEQPVQTASHEHEDKQIYEFFVNSVHTYQLGEIVELPLGLGLVIGRQRSCYHVLFIGLKTNHTRFNSDELRWLKTMANYASIVFENLFLLEGLIEELESEVRKEQSSSPWIMRMLFMLSENERRKLAADLHDSALQDQLLWYRKLEAIMLDVPLTDKLGRELEDIKEGLLDVIHQIRETCNELRPPLLKEMGVIEAVESLIEHTQMRVNFEVRFQYKQIPESLDEEQITTIYRIVQELLRNADKHARAKLIVLELESRDAVLNLKYKDDGIGMEVDQMEETFEHMGLSGIKERVVSLGGSIEFFSGVHKGLEVVIAMPVFMVTGYSDRSVHSDKNLVS